MNTIILASIIAVSTAAQLPSRNYIAQAQVPSRNYIVQAQVPSRNYIAQAQVPSRNYIAQAQVPSGSYQNFQRPSAIIGGSGSDSGNRRPQQEIEKNAVILKQELVIAEDGSYHHGYETSNGIRSEEAGNTVQAQGGFSYKGDDGNVYTVTFTSGEGGFRPQGEHLPVPPPTPEAILEALKKNEIDEAAGIFDDGKYRPDVHGGGHQAGQGSGRPGGHNGGFNVNTGYQY